METESDIRDEEEAIEVDYDLNPTDLYTCICACAWNEALVALEKNPIEAMTWVVKRDPCSDDDDAVRFLPLHSACARQPPLDIIISLLTVYSEASSIIDDNGMYPLHYACANQASAEVIELLLLHNPDANTCRVEMNGALPIHLSAQWGVNTPSVIEVLLHYNKSLACARDNDGLSPLELAMNADEYEYKEDVIEILHTTFEVEAMNDGDDSTLSSRFTFFEKGKKKPKRDLMKELEEMRNVIIFLRERKQHLMLNAEQQVALEWEAVNMSIAAMKTEIEEMKPCEPVMKSPSVEIDVEDDDESTCDQSRTKIMNDDQGGGKDSDTSTANTSKTSISEIEVKVEKAEETNENHDETIDRSKNSSRVVGLAKKVNYIGSKLTTRTWLSQWRQTAERSSTLYSSAGSDKYANPFDDDDDSDNGDGIQQDMDRNGEDVGNNTDCVKLKGTTTVKEENEDPANGTKGSNEMSLSREVQEIAKEKAAREVQVQDIAKKKSATRSTRIRAQEERVQKAQEKKIKEKKIEELQREYEGMEREFAHYSRRRDTHIVKVDIVKESVTELNMEIRKALKRQGETKERLEAIKATSAVRRNHIKSMVREMDGDPALLHKVNGVDALMKREYKATRIMDQILSDL